MRHMSGSGPVADEAVNEAGVMAVIGNRMEPDRGSARLCGDVRRAVACGGRTAPPK
jgi:hypothetical protein